MKRLLTLLLLFTVCILNAQTLLPKSEGKVITYKYYIFSFNKKHKQANWVYYKLTPEYINGNAKRTDDFRVNNMLSDCAALADYKGSGYDRGHLCPAAAMKISKEAMSETFFMSNMSPQKPYFNRGIWKKLEGVVRNWVIKEKELYVVTGPIFKDNLGIIGRNKVTVPGYYYKAIYDPTGEKKMIALILKNEKSSKLLSSFVVSVDKLEEITGIDFFEGLDDEIENKLEAKSDIGKWEWKQYRSSGGKDDAVVANQCKGIAKSTGQRCKNKTKNENGYCHIHQSQAPGYKKAETKTTYSGQCCATTKKGTRCKRKAAAGSRYCWQHQR